MKITWKKAISVLAIFVAFFVVSACGKKTKNYTVTFKNAGEPISVVVKEKSLVAKPETDPVKEGYYFDGWYADTAYTKLFDFGNTKITKDTTIYAKFIMIGKVHFKTNGGTLVESKECLEITEAPVTTKTGHSFEGWYYDSNFTKPVTFPAKIAGTITMYANWIVTGYDVNFVTNSNEVVNFEKQNYGTSINYVDLDVSKKEGAISLEGWYLDEKLTSKATFPYTITDAITFYAKWNMRKINVHFIDNNLLTANKEITSLSTILDYGTAIKLDNYVYSKTDYIFEGWYLDETLINSVPNGYILTDDLSNETLHIYFYAKLSLNNNTVELDSNGGTYDGTSIKVFKPSNDTEKVHIQINRVVPSKLGYRFIGYRIKKADGSLGDFISNLPEFAKTTLSESYTLIAEWEEIQFKLTIYVDDNYKISIPGEHPANSSVNVKDYLDTIDDSYKTREGMIFKGVCLKENECTEYYENQFQIVDQSTSFDYEDNGVWYRYIVLYLAFESEKFDLTVHANSGYFGVSGSGSTVLPYPGVKYGTTIEDLNITEPIKTGYQFAGWCIDSDSCSVPVDNTYAITSSINLYAKWEISKYYISVTNIDGGDIVLLKNVPYQTKTSIQYLYEWDENVIANLSNDTGVVIYHLGTKTADNKDLIVYYNGNFSYFNISDYSSYKFLGFYNDYYSSYIASFTMTGNVLLYPKFDTSKEIVYKLNDDGIAYSAYSFGTLDNSSKDITISSVFMGKEVEKISKNCFSNEDSLKIESLFIPETVSVIENNSFVYLLNLNKLTIPVFSNYFSFSKLFGTNDEFIISHLKYLKITGGSLERFVISTENSTGLEGLQYLKIIQELHLPYSIDDFYDSTIDFLAELQNLRDFKIEVRENSSQKFYVAEYNSSSSTFQIMRNATGTIAYEFKRNNGNIIDEVELKYSISFIDNELNQLKTPLTNLSIGEKLVNFNTSEDYIPTKEGYTFVGWWYYEEVDGVVELTEPYIYEDLKVMFAENVQLCAKFIKGNVVVENNIIVSISELSEEENILVIEKYYRGNLLEGIDLTSMESTLEYVQAIEFPDSIKKITLSGKVPALQSISMAANMYQCVVDDKSKCKAVEIYKSAIGKSNIPETATLEIKIIHSDNDSINQIIDAFDGLEKINITKLTLPSSLIFDILSYPMMFKELHNVSGYAITDIDGYNNVVVGENGCLYGLVYNTSNETEWALLRSPMRSVSEELSTGTLVGKESIKQIAPYAFYKIHNITKITMNDGKSNSQIYILGDYSFASMDDLTSIMIGMSVREISKFAFDSSYSITEFDIDQFNGVYSVLDGVLFKSHETILVKYPANKDASYYAIPLGVKEIAEYAFMLNENIGIDLEIGKNVITISGYSNFSEFAYWEELKLNNFVNVKSFIVDEDNAVFTSVNGSLYSKDYSVLIRFGKNSDSKQVLLLPSIKTIFKDAFLYNTENLISYLSKQIECILIDNANNEDLSELLGDSEHGIGKYFSNLGFNAQNLIIYFGTFEGFADLETNPMYTVVTPDSSFRLYTEGNLHIGGEELHIGNNKEYFEYADLMINEAPVTSSSSVFIGWYLDSDYQIPAKFPLLSITNGSLKYVSLYAKFGTSYLVTFDSKGGTSIESINYIDVITKDTLPINPEKTGYKFGGWYLDSALTKPLFSETESYELSLPTTPLYAKWNVEVTIYVRDIETYTFKILNSVNGESWYFGTGDSLNKHLGEEYNKYRWYTDSDCTNEISYSRAINSSITIYGIPYHEVEIEIVYLEEDKVTELDRRQISVDVALETTINQLDVYQELIGAYIIKSIYLDKNESAATNSTSAISFNVNFIRIYCYMM